MPDKEVYDTGNQYDSYGYDSVTQVTTSLTPIAQEHVPLPYPAGGIMTELNDQSIIYNSYAGVDIVAQVLLPNSAPITLGELQTISYSIHRENAPVRLLGHVSPVSFIRGGRTIAGSMIFTVFNNYAFYRLQHFQTAIASGIYPVADMLPPLDMILTFANENGVFSKMKLFGVTFLDEGSAMSIDDLITEATFQYVARGIQPLTGYSYGGESNV